MQADRSVRPAARDIMVAAIGGALAVALVAIGTAVSNAIGGGFLVELLGGATAQQLSAVANDVGSAQGRVDEVESRVGEVESRVGEVEGRVGEVEGRVGEVEGRVGEVEGRVGEVQSHVGELESRVDEIDSRIAGDPVEAVGWDVRLTVTSSRFGLPLEEIRLNAINLGDGPVLFDRVANLRVNGGNPHRVRLFAQGVGQDQILVPQETAVIGLADSKDATGSLPGGRQFDCELEYHLREPGASERETHRFTFPCETLPRRD